MTEQDKKDAMHRLARSLDECVEAGAVDEVIKAAQKHIPEEHKRVNVVSALLIMAAKKILGTEGYDSDQQARFVTAAANVIHYENEVPGAGVAVVGSTPSEEWN